jgi:hypothetical protein
LARLLDRATLVDPLSHLLTVPSDCAANHDERLAIRSDEQKVSFRALLLVVMLRIIYA